MSASKKEYILFVLDTSPSMNQLWDNHDKKVDVDNQGNQPTKFSYAKKLIHDIVGNLIIHSHRYHVGIITTSSSSSSITISDRLEEETSSRQDSKQNRKTNFTFFRPSVALLQQIDQLSLSSSSSSSSSLNENDNFWNGIQSGMNTILQTKIKSSNKCTVLLLTDAKNPISSFSFSYPNIQKVIDCFQQSPKLWNLLVLGFQFHSNDNNNNSKNNSSIHHHPSKRNNDMIQTENENFLHSFIPRLSHQSQILPISSPKDDEIQRQKINKVLFNTKSLLRRQSTKSKLILEIAPNLSVEAISALYVTKTNIPTLKREVVLLENDDDTKIMIDGAGEMMTSAITTSISYWEQDEEVTYDQRTKAFRYGSDLIPMGTLDMHGLTYSRPHTTIQNNNNHRNMKGGSIQILGYTSKSKIPKWALMGPSRTICGDGNNNRRACVAISALAQALFRLQQYAICSYITKENADPIMGVLLSSYKKQQHLFFLQLPFANDVVAKMNLLSNIILPSQKSYFTTTTTTAHAVNNTQSFTTQNNATKSKNRQEQEQRCCDEFIDSLLISNDHHENDKESPHHHIIHNNPNIQSFYDTIRHRALNPTSQDIIIPTSNKTNYVHLNNTSQLNAFRNTFPLEKINHLDTNAAKKRKFWSSFESSY